MSTEISQSGFGKRMDRKWVAVASFADKTIIAFGNDPAKVLKRAEKKGFGDPVIFFNPKTTDVLVGGRYYEKGADGLLKPISEQ